MKRLNAITAGLAAIVVTVPGVASVAAASPEIANLKVNNVVFENGKISGTYTTDRHSTTSVTISGNGVNKKILSRTGKANTYSFELSTKDLNTGTYWITVRANANNGSQVQEVKVQLKIGVNYTNSVQAKFGNVKYANDTITGSYTTDRHSATTVFISGNGVNEKIVGRTGKGATYNFSYSTKNLKTGTYEVIFRANALNGSEVQEYRTTLIIPQKGNTNTSTGTSSNTTTSNTTTNSNIVVSGGVTHTVQKGETLTSIAKKYNTHPNHIKVFSNLKSDSVSVGQKLVVTPEKAVSQYRTVVNVSSLIGRTGPGDNFKAKTSYKAGTKVQVITSVSNGWYKVKANDVVGYVNGKYLSSPITNSSTSKPSTGTSSNTNTSGTTSQPSTSTITETAVSEYRTVTNCTYLNGRTGPAASYKIKTSFKAGTKVQVLASVSNGWYKVQGNGVVAYVNGKYLSSPITSNNNSSSNTGTNSPSSNTGSNSSNSSSPSKEYATVTATKLNFRDTPNGVVKFDIAKGQKVEVLAVNGDWTQVLYNGYNGWVASEHLSFQNTSSTNNTSSNLNYTVQLGDTMLSIAKKFGLTVEQLKQINHLETDLIYVGQMLAISADSTMAKLVRPAEGMISSEYGYRLSTGKSHNGIDIAKDGDVKVVAIADGVVTKSYTSQSYGEVIFVKHTIDGKEYEAVYAHLREKSRMVKVGDKVKAGQQIAWMGTTGNSTGQHLHLEIHDGEWNYEKTNAINPRKLMNF